MKKNFKFKNLTFRRNYFFLLKRLLLRKLFRFNRKNKRFFRRVFSKFIFRISGNRSYPKYLIKKHFCGYSFDLVNSDKRNTTFFNRRFITRSNFSYTSSKATSLLIRSSLLIKSSVLDELKNLKGLSTFKFFKKNNFRTKSLTLGLTNFRLNKSIILFSKKGNKNSIFNSVFREFCNYRSFLFSYIFYNFYDNDSLLDVCLLQKHALYSLDQKVSNNNNITYRFKFSILMRQLLGVFYKFRSKKVEKRSILLKFFLNRSKLSFLLSSIRAANSIFKPFYIYVETKPWKKSGRPIVVPTPIKSKSRRLNMFSHWVKESALVRNESSVSKKFIGEISDLALRQGLSIQKLSSMRKTIKANRSLIRKSRIVLI